METKVISETDFQRECDRFVGREVYCCLTYEVNYILKQSWEDKDAPISYDDVENGLYWQCPNCNDTMDEIGDGDGDLLYKCPSCEHEQGEDPDQEYQEIYEWWAVSR